MPIILSTRELVGLLGDVLPFVATDEDDVAHTCVRVEWNPEDETLFTLATNRSQAVRSVWDVDSEEGEEEVPYAYGLLGDDPAFSVRVATRSAKDIVSAFKLPDKISWAPVEVSVILNASNIAVLKVQRKASGDLWPALTMHVAGRGAPIEEDGDPKEVDIHKIISQYVGQEGETGTLAFSAKLLGNLAKVERHGPLEFSSFAEGGAPVYIKAGERFDGIFMQVNMNKPR